MRLLLIVSLLAFYVSVLEASYARSIRVSSFITKSDANRALDDIKEFISNNDRLVEIQEDQGFRVTVIKTGKYYMHNLQPFTNKQLVQETLDILRTKYEYVYPRKIKFKSSYLHNNRERSKSYKKEEHYQVVKRELKPSINREKLMSKIDDVLQNKKVALKKSSDTTYPKLDLDLPTMKYTFLEIKGNNLKKKKLHDASSAPMTLFRSYMVEILIAAGVVILLLLIAIFYRYRKNKENRITIQEIYN